MKVIVFDMDGVIFDSESTNLDAWNVVADKYGFERPDIPYRQTIGVKAEFVKEIYCDYYGQDFPYEKYSAEKSRIFHSKYDGGNLPIKRGAREILAFLKENGYYVALASSTAISKVEMQIKDAELYDYFDRIIGGDMVARSKPEPDIFLKAIEGLGVNPADVYVIEDSFNGIRAAFNAGMIPLMVPDMLPPDDEMKQKAAHIFDNLCEVKDFIQSKNTQE